MSDDDKAKKATGKRKRDRNQPTPKPKKRSKVPGLIVGAVLSVLLLWVGLYSAEVGKAPTSWTSEEWSGFLTFSEQQVAEARRNVEQIDWDSLGAKITAETKQLWEKVPDLEQKLEQKLAELRGTRQEAPAGGAPAKADDEQKAPAAVPAQPTSLELGCEALREAIGHYRKSMNDQDKLRAAKKEFRAAQVHLEAAYAEAEGDPAQQAEIEGYLMQCNTYLEDCSKRETL